MQNALAQKRIIDAADHAQKEGTGVGDALQILKLERSQRKGKKLCATLSDGRRIDFGSDVSTTYSEGAPEKKMQAYFARHLANPVEGRKIRDLEMSPALLSAYVLWYSPDMEKNVAVLNSLLREKR